MAKTYVATQQELQATNTQVTNLQNVVQNPTGGLEARVTLAEMDITNLGSTIGASDSAGLRKRITDNETAIGDSNSGLIKQVNDFDSLKQDAITGAATTITDNNLTADRVIVSDGSGKIVVSNITLNQLTSLSGLTFDSTANRYTQSTAPASAATADEDLLTKFDGDNLYALTENTVQTTGFTMSGAINMDNNDITGANKFITSDEGDTEGYHLVDTSKGMSYTANAGLKLSDGSLTVRIDTDRMKTVGDNVAFLGDSGNRWKAIYSTNSTINTSDGRLKNKLSTDDLDKLSKHWFDCVKIQKWSWKKEPEKSRFGVIAQDVEKAFELAGLNIDNYAIIERGDDGYLHVVHDEIKYIEMYCLRKKLGL